MSLGNPHIQLEKGEGMKRRIILILLILIVGLNGCAQEASTLSKIPEERNQISS